MRVEFSINTQPFLVLCSKLKYKYKDCLEVQQYTNGRLKNPYELYKSMNHRWMEYYVITDTINDKVVCTIALDTCNRLHYFVTEDLTPKNTKRFIKAIKKLADDTIERRRVVFVTTSNSYQEAIKFNKLIGMYLLETIETENKSVWYYAKTDGTE